MVFLYASQPTNHIPVQNKKNRNISKVTIIKKLCSLKKLVKLQSGQAEKPFSVDLLGRSHIFWIFNRENLLNYTNYGIAIRKVNGFSGWGQFLQINKSYLKWLCSPYLFKITNRNKSCSRSNCKLVFFRAPFDTSCCPIDSEIRKLFWIQISQSKEVNVILLWWGYRFWFY